MDHTQVTNINEVVKSHWKLKCSTLIYPEILCWKLPQFLSCVPRIPSNFVNLVCIFNCSEKYSDSIKRIFTCVFWNIWLAVSFFWNKVRVFCILSLFPFAIKCAQLVRTICVHAPAICVQSKIRKSAVLSTC